MVSNKNLKDYFTNNPTEKEILVNDIQKHYAKKSDKFLFKSLEVIPEYLLPTAIIATTPEQIQSCTIGTQSILPVGFSGAKSTKTLQRNLGSWVVFAELDNPAFLIQNLVGFPAAVDRFKNRSSDKFAYEDPTLMDAKALEPTSGRKLWKLRHGKSIRKHLKKDKQGYIGGS